jgi:hypothetical protein
MSSGWPHGAGEREPWSGMGWVRYRVMVRRRPEWSPEEMFLGLPLPEPDPRVVVPRQRRSPEDPA